ncbi:energy transducer TonB [Xylanibacter ruminicola]|jgi:protein TonB|uniref:Protein TonB n=1 Tax=Xylanibacter ruminicola TaxID=839 RepID=A0A1M6UQH4_XYLRU|nr:energy transducer TonB [Xylanibacter ruminicola]SHK71438.1 protein TonB [Xylanibacter ruminicola]
MKKFLIMALMALFGLTTVSAQKTVVAQKNQQVFDVVEKMPEYPGGQAALFEYLSTNIKYPADAEKQKIEGRVLVTFVVNTDGSITDIEVVKKAFPSLDAEAVRVISGMPKWTPGEQKGQKVRVKYTVPLNFRLK